VVQVLVELEQLQVLTEHQQLLVVEVEVVHHQTQLQEEQVVAVVENLALETQEQ
tara:strand:- start:4 stop:165 length:162 start_codon:yes stop_codon:yes gene_type:complete